MTRTIEAVSLDKIRVQKNNVRRHDIDVGKEELAANIKANGLLQPIAAYFDSEKNIYVILTGQRRFNAYHHLNENYPGQGFDKIDCIIINEPESDEKKLSLSLAENITQLPMTNMDTMRAVTDLYNVYGDYELVQQDFGITQKQVDAYVRLSRLPDEVKDAIKNGEISPKPKVALTMALKAVDSTNYTKNGPIAIATVIELAQEMSKGEADVVRALAGEARKGGSVMDMKKRAEKKPKQKINIDLDTPTAEKLKRVSEDAGESETFRASQYVVDGVDKDYKQLDV